MAKFIRRMLCLATMILLIVALGTVCFAEGVDEPVCYEHGDVNGDGYVTNADAIYIMYHYMFGDEEYPIDQEWDFDGDSQTDNKDAIYIMYHYMFDEDEDYKLNGTIHSYYDPSWTWDETTNTAEVIFKCGCGKTKSYTTENGVTVTSDVVEAKCEEAGLATYSASVVVDGKTYSSTYEKVLPAKGHRIGTPDCENGSKCADCDYALPALGHNMILNANVDAACTQNAYQEYKCANAGCQHTETVEQPGTAGHVLEYDKDVKDGCKYTKWYKCGNCDHTAEGIAASDVYYNHTYTATLTTDATCVSKGVKTYTCQCGDSYTGAIPVNGSHNWVEGATVEGITTHTCSREGCTATKTTVSATGTALEHKDLSNELQLEGGASMSLDQNTLAGLDSNKQVVVSITPLQENDAFFDRISQEKKNQIGDNTVYNFNMSYSDGSSISDGNTTNFAGEVTVSLPYELAEGEDIDSIDVWYINDLGEPTRVTGTYSNGYVTFTTTHFSYYTVTRLTPAERCDRYGHIMVATKKDATCTEDGYDVAVCQRCGYVEKNIILTRTGHDYNETVITEAGCVTVGEFRKVCQTCQHTTSGTIPATGHNMIKDESQTVAAGCNNVGKEVYVCANGCGHTQEYVKAQLTHNYVPYEEKSADCTTGGYVKNICTRCNDIVTVSETAPEGHAYELVGWNWSADKLSAVANLRCTHNSDHTKEISAVVTVLTEKATCTGGGSATYTAKAYLNGKAYEDISVDNLTATGHKADSQWHSNAGQHYHVCTACGVELDAQDHTFDNGTVTKKATCAVPGTMEYKCVICGYTTEETIPATNQHILDNGTVIEKATCTTSGMVEYKCIGCEYTENRITPATNKHIMDGGTVIKEVTCAVPGMLEYKCATCDYTETEIIPATNEHIYVGGVCSGCGKIEGCDHSSFTTTEKDLTTHGMCGGTLVTTHCACGEISETAICDEVCQWQEMVDPDKGYGYVCSVCGTFMQNSYWEELMEGETCLYNTYNYYVFYDKNGAVLFSYEARGTMGLHSFIYELELKEGSVDCEDGYIVHVTCRLCGITDRWEYYEHVTYLLGEQILSKGQLCGTLIQETRGCACGEYCEKSLSWRDGQCSWEYHYSQELGEYRVCSVCGAYVIREMHSEKIPGTTCQRKWVYLDTYFDRNDNALFTYETEIHYSNHRSIYELVLKEGATDCEGGYTVYQSCELCDYTDSWEENGHCSYTVERTILSQGQLCGTLVRETESCACGEYGSTSTSWIDGECQWEWKYSEELGEYRVCATCGATIINTVVEEKIPGTTCDYQRIWRYTYYDRNGTELCHDETTSEFQDHAYIYQLQLKEGAADCEGGYIVYISCELCDHEDSREEVGHRSYVLEREILSEGQLCGTLMWITEKCACGEYFFEGTRWSGGMCMMESVYTEELGWHSVCSTCGAYMISSNDYVKVPGTTCDYQWVYTYTYYDKDDNTLFSYQTVTEQKQHEYIHRLQLKEGATDCYGGVIVTGVCRLCGFTETWETTEHTSYLLNRQVLSVGQLCGTLVWDINDCACGENYSESLNWLDGECRWEWVESEELGSYPVCSVCGAYRITANWEEKIPGTTCDYQRIWQYTYYDKNGVELFSYQEVYEDERHEFVHELYLAAGATDCDGGVIVHGTCLLCGHTSSWENMGHGSFLVEREILSQGQLCGTLAWDTNDCACGQSYSKSLNWLNGECQWDWVYSEELGNYQVCSVCGAYIIRADWEEKVPGTTCDYRHIYQYTYYDQDGLELFSYQEVDEHKTHEYIYQLQLKDEAAGCDGGYIVTGCCRLCNYTSSGENSGHETYLVNREILSQGQLCGTLLRNTRSCACGEYHETEINWENGECQWENIFDEEKQQWVNHCSGCGTTYSYETHKERVEGTTCQYYEHTVYTYCDPAGNVLFTYTNTSLERYHNCVFTFSMIGNTCAEGVYPIGTCQDCGDVQEYSLHTDCIQFRVARRVIVDSNDICGTVTLDRYSCACGDNSYWQIFDGCQWDWTDDHAACSNCGLQRTDSSNTVRKPLSCEKTTTYHYEFVLNGQSYEAEYTSVNNEHKIYYSFDLLGDTCADGYYVIKHCMYCDYSYTEEEVQYTNNHDSDHIVAAYDLTDYGLCDGGYIYFYSCPCGQRGEVTYNYGCDRISTGKTDPVTGMEEYYCEKCGVYSYDENSVVHDKANCLDDGAFRMKLVRDSETLLEEGYTYRRAHHDYEVISNTLVTEGTDCTEGILQTTRCAVCGETKTEGYSYHATMLTQTVDLTEHGACCGYVEVYSCACGAEKKTEFHQGDDHAWEEDTWKDTDATGVVHTYIYRECAECAMTWLSDSTDEKLPDVPCKMETNAFNTVTVGDYTFFYEEQWWWYQHNYDITYELLDESQGCLGGVLKTGICADCQEEYTTTDWGHTGIKTESIDLSDYGAVCGSTLDLYACLCGAQKGYQFGGEPGCDVNQENWEETKHWIEGVIDEHQESVHGNATYSDSYLIKCAVTDPEACGLTIRMSRYWLKDGCKVTEYETWQLGYDEATGTCQKEITIATGNTHSYHNYVYSNIEQTLENGSASGYKYTCSDCGSYYSYVATYDADENRVKEEQEIVNKLDNGERQKRCYVYNYEMISGKNCQVMFRAEYTEADGSLTWDEKAYTYDIANCKRSYVYTDSNGQTIPASEEYHHSGTYETSVINPTCTQHGEERWWYVCDACGKHYHEDWTVLNPGHDWVWNEELQIEVCSVCGLQNKNGASGAIVMEDLTDARGNGESYVIGYWNQDDLDYQIKVSVVLESTGEQILLDITEFTDHTVENDGFNGLSFDKAAADAAAAEAVAVVGYEGAYAIRISFVAVNGANTLDYAITFDSVTAA